METNAKNFTMRMAVMEDAPEILAIYEPYIRKTTITFEYEVPTVEAFRQRMAGILGAYPYLVCEMDGKIAAYAYAHRFQERAAYQWNAELSVYVDENCTGMGMGKALYQALIEILKCQNVKNAYALVTSPNEKSDASINQWALRLRECPIIPDIRWANGWMYPAMSRQLAHMIHSRRKSSLVLRWEKSGLRGF